MRARWFAPAVAVCGALGFGGAAAAQTTDPVCLQLTERLRGSEYPGVETYGAMDFAYRLYIADRGLDARPVVGPDALRAATLERLPRACAGSPAEALAFLMRAFVRAGDLDGALAASRGQLEIAQAPSAVDEARRNLTVVLLARGDEPGAAVVLRPTRPNLSDTALLAEAYRRATAGGMAFGYATPLQMSLLEAAVRNGRLRMTQPRQAWEAPEEDLAVLLTELGERRRSRGEADAAVAAYAEATALLRARAERLNAERPQGWQSAVVTLHDLATEAYAGLAESAAARGDREQVVKAAQAGAGIVAGQRFAAPGSGVQGQIATFRFSGDPTARPAAKRIERMADSLLEVGEAGFAAELYEAEASAFAGDSARVADLGRAYTKLASARRLQGDFTGAGEAVELAAKALAYGVSGERRSTGPSTLNTERAALLLEKAQLAAVQSDRDGACRMLGEVAALVPGPNGSADDKKVAQDVATARSAMCPKT